MKYNNAPIREAIFDVRIENLGVSDYDKLEEIHQFIKESYPIKQKQTQFAGKIEIENEEIKTPFNSSFRGFILKSKDEKKQVQVRLDGFTFNWINPYSNWEEFSTEAFKLWKIYREKLKPEKVTRIALRYINKIDIPLPFNNFQDYILNMPPIPRCLPQSYSHFFMQIEVPCIESDSRVVLTQTIQPQTKNTLPFILDIDTFKTGDFEKDKRSMMKHFLDLRKIKNDTFENCITDKTRNLFN